MSHRFRLKLASCAFALSWTAGMIWQGWPLQPAEIGILVVSAALAGVVWHWLYGSWYRWHFTRHIFPRKRLT